MAAFSRIPYAGDKKEMLICNGFANGITPSLNVGIFDALGWLSI